MTELTVITDRELKIAYIKKAIAGGNKEYANTKTSYLWHFKATIITEMDNTCDNDEGCEYNQSWVRYWVNAAYNKVVESIDWTTLNQCPECHTYFDNGDGVDDDRFCSDDCQVVYVEEPPDQDER